MELKRKSRADEEPSVAAGSRKQPRRESDQHPSQEQRQPARKKRNTAELRKAMDEHIFNCGCPEPTQAVCVGMWQQLLLSTANEGESELRMALELVEGPWTLSPKFIVHYFRKFAYDDIKWIIRFFWKCHRLYAKELSWTEVLAAIKSAAMNDKSHPRVWTREAFREAQNRYIFTALKNKRSKSSAAKIAEQTPTEHHEQTTTRNNSPQRLGGGRGTIESPSFSESAAKPLTASAVSPTDNSGSISNNESSSISHLLPAKSVPRGHRDVSNVSVDRESTPPDVLRLEANQSSSGDSNAPVEVEDNTRPGTAAIIEELESQSPVSTVTLRSILARFIPAQNKVNFASDNVRVVDLRHLIRASASEQTQEQEADHEASERLRPVSDRDIEEWTPSGLDCDGIKTFVLPFTTQPEDPSVFYFLEDTVCHVYHTTLAQESMLLTRTLPDKLIRAVAGSEGAKTWKTELFTTQGCYDRSRKDHPREEDFGLQALASCLEHDLPKAHTANSKNLRFPFSMDTGFWRAVLATAFHGSAGTRFFNDWLEGKWSPQEPEPTPVHGEDPFHQYYAGTIKARETVAKADRRKSRLTRVLEVDIGKLQTWVRYAHQRFVDTKEMITAKRKETRDRTDSDFKTLEQKTKWNLEKFFPGVDTDLFTNFSGPFFSGVKLLHENLCKKERDLLQVQEHAAEDALKFQDQLLAALESGKAYAQTMEINAEVDVQEAKDLLRDTHREETVKFNEEQARIAEQQARTEQAAKRAKEMFAGLIDIGESS